MTAAKGFGEHPEQALGHPAGVRRRREVAAHDDELVPAEASDEIARSSRVPEPSADLHEQRVAPGVAEAVVHNLEAVQVAEQHREAAAAVAQAVEGPGQPRVQHRAVRESGELVVRGLGGPDDVGGRRRTQDRPVGA